MNNNEQIDDEVPILCSNCFTDFGLRHDAEKHGLSDPSVCNNCKTITGKKLTKSILNDLAYFFFVKGTMNYFDYGAAPGVQYNDKQFGNNALVTDTRLDADIKLIENALKIGFFNYGPRLWMLGEVEPLKALLAESERDSIVSRILNEYPVYEITPPETFFRVRKNLKNQISELEFDSPPSERIAESRLGTQDFPVLYASPDIECCIHECRATIEDVLYISQLTPASKINLLDLSYVLEEECLEFDSLDIAVHMLFAAGKHAYETTQTIAKAAYSAGLDGIIYPSFFSRARTGINPFDTVYGISVRRIRQYRDAIMRNVVQSICIFGRPIEDRRIVVKSINRLLLEKASYDFHFGPVAY